jgi:seryl-tRNA(Sec) selenium transferase
MNLKFKKPSHEAQKAMSNASMKPHVSQGISKEIINAEEMVKSFTGHQYAKIVNSGNSAIMSVMNSLDGPFILPDQGGWIGFKKIAEFLGKAVITIETNMGLVSPDELEELINNSTNNPSTLFITSFAGYTAEQPVKELYEVCNQNDIILVEDASGSVGDPEKNLCNGQHAHVILASTGSPKMVNVGNGGFISTDNREIVEKSRFLLKMFKADPVTCAGINQEIKLAPENLTKTMDACNYLKNNLKNVFHKDKRGINVILSSENPKKNGSALRKDIHADGRSIITTCPQYNRLLEKAVCIEIKNLDTSCLSKENLKQIKEIVETTTF